MSWVQNLHTPQWSRYPRHGHPLYYAASFGLDKTLELLIAQGVRVDAPGSRNGGTALHAAVLRQIVPAMKVLLDAGADPENPDFQGHSPLDSAISWRNKEVIQMLAQYGADIDSDEIDLGAEVEVEGETSMQVLLLQRWASGSKKR